ncbi:MAG: integrase [Desulfatibacillaceae bacterium]|nr:integrase [Desulfatibacillaceae bacterium]
MPYKRGPKWVGQVRKMHQGRQFKKEKKFDTKAEAKAWETRMQSKPVNDWLPATGTTCLGDWAQEYLDFAKARFSVKTYKEKRLAFRLLFQSADPSTPVENLKPLAALKHIQKQQEQRSGYAANKDRKNLLAGWAWGIKYMDPPLPEPNPFMVERMPEKRHPRYIPSFEDVWKVYDMAKGQDRCMLLAYIHLAARRGEIFRLKWEDVDFQRARVRLFTRKRQSGTWEFDWLPMTEDLKEALEDQRKKVDSEWVFPNPETKTAYYERKRWLKGLCQEAGVQSFGLHSIRHLSASILAQDGVPAVHIQAILRHKKLSTTERYLHQLGDLRASIEVLSRKQKPSGEPSTPQTAFAVKLSAA